MKKEEKSRNSKELVREINNQKGALESGAHVNDGGKSTLDQQEVAGRLHNGRPLPPVETVKDADVKSGVAKRCADQQVGENRVAINSRVEKDNEHGSNN